ncbi:MAG: hypothetical protein ACMXYD_00675 [Candidatus Woesearchaeota archaeon]
MRFSNKKALELATNTIVLLIVGILILTLSISLTYGVFCTSIEYSEQVDRQSQAQLERLLSTGGRVQVADNTKKVENQGNFLCVGNTQRTAEFVLGIQNNNAVETKTFTIEVEPGTYAQLFNEVTIPARESHSTTILFVYDEPVTEQKTYTIRVRDETNLYGVQRVYVNP